VLLAGGAYFIANIARFELVEWSAGMRWFEAIDADVS